MELRIGKEYDDEKIKAFASEVSVNTTVQTQGAGTCPMDSRFIWEKECRLLNREAGKRPVAPWAL